MPDPPKKRANLPESGQVSKITDFFRALWLTVRLDWALLWDGRVRFWPKLLLLLVVGYVAFPFDVIADAVPVLGQLDDVLVFFLGSRAVWELCPRWVVGEHLQRLRAQA